MRIIAGSARGVTLKAPKTFDTRPTADRIKESLFNILGNKTLDANVLDLFAGTGALGLEALSRGAARAVFVDKSTTNLIKENAAKTKLSEKVTVKKGNVSAVIKLLDGEKFDLIFCDAPYAKGLTEKTLEALHRSDIVADNALIAVEHGRNEDFSSPFFLLRRVDYGHTTSISFFRKFSETHD